MAASDRIGRGFRRAFHFPLPSRARVGAEVDEELDFHIASVAARLAAEGRSPEQALDEARRQFGDLDYTRQFCADEDLHRTRGRHRMTTIDEITQDLRYAARSLRRAPGFTAVALLTLALGIGANTAVFSVVRAVLLSPLPFATPDRIVRVWNANRVTGTDKGALSEPDFLDWRAQSRTTESMGGSFYAEGLGGVDLTGQGAPERITTALVNDGFFATLRPTPLLGRTLVPADQTGDNHVVVIGNALWKGHFNADPAIIGKVVQINGQPFTVVGVMPADFTYPADNALDAWIPLSFFGPNSIGRARASRFLSVVARKKPGVTDAQVLADFDAIATRGAASFPENAGWNAATILPIRDSIVGDVRRPIVVLFGAVGLLLLITCVNIASLLLARASARQSELAIRAALGAGRGRIVRQLLTESLLLAVAGGALGTLLAYGAASALHSGGVQLPGGQNVRIDGVMLAFTFAAAMVAGLLFGLLPALRAATRQIEQSLRADTRGSVGARGQKLRSSLVLAEVALAVMLVVGAGLATKSFARLLSVDPGFRPEKALHVSLGIGQSHMVEGKPDVSRNYYYSLINAIAAVPGVTAVGAIRDLPTIGHGEGDRIDVPGSAIAPGAGPIVQIHQISADYFKAMGIPILAGRAFTMDDRGGRSIVVIANEEFVHRFWPTVTPAQAVGKAMDLGGGTMAQIVGIAGNVRQNGIAEPVEPAIYMHILISFRAHMSIVARTAGDPSQVENAVRRAIWSVDPLQTITTIQPLEDVVGKSVARQRVLAWLLGAFGLIALALGALGIYGVLAFAVAQRRKEIGVRVALGASPRSVMSLIVGRGALLAAAGIVVGIVAARLLSRTMQSVLYGIEPTDLVTFVEVIIVLFAAALVASWLPARRALKIDPVSALRAD